MQDFSGYRDLIVIMQIIQIVLSPSVVALVIFFISWPTIKRFIVSKTTNVNLQNDLAEKQNKKSIFSSKLLNTASSTLGDVCSLKGSYDEAINYYLQALGNDPENASAYLGLGNAYFKKGQLAEAIEALEKSVFIKPYWADARCNLGAAYSTANNYEKAIDEYIQAININPNYSNAHFGLGKTYLTFNKLDKAKEQVAILKELDPSASAMLSQLINQAGDTGG